MAGRWFAFTVCVISVASLLVPGLVGAGPASTPAGRTTSPSASQPAKPTEAQIRQMVKQLSHPVHAKRRAAVRQFAEWGPVAFPELRRVAHSADMEAALSAQGLLRELESAILIGARVRLKVDRARVAWNEAFTLTVEAVNSTGERIEVPWSAGGDAPTSRPQEGGQDARPPQSGPAEGGRDACPPGDEPRQVAAMMDAGDFLVVTGPDGQPIDLRVEPIERDPKVYAAVNLRARGKPPSHPMPAGTSDRLLIPLFNRGWARYPMLAAGRYMIAFSYQPQWDDLTWTKDSFGLVASEPVTIEVTESAPEPIRLADKPLRIRVTRDGDSLAAELESTWDREMWINLNLGDNLHTHAQIEWRLNAKEDGDDDQPLRWVPDSTGEKFDVQHVRELRPGERLIVSRVPLAVLRERLSKTAHPPAQPEASVRYMSLASAPQIREETADKGRAVDAPTHLYSGTLTSESAPLDPK